MSSITSSFEVEGGKYGRIKKGKKKEVVIEFLSKYNINTIKKSMSFAVQPRFEEDKLLGSTDGSLNTYGG